MSNRDSERLSVDHALADDAVKSAVAADIESTTAEVQDLETQMAGLPAEIEAAELGDDEARLAGLLVRHRMLDRKLEAATQRMNAALLRQAEGALAEEYVERARLLEPVDEWELASAVYERAATNRRQLVAGRGQVARQLEQRVSRLREALA